MNTINTGALMIALRQQTVAGRDFLPADKFDVQGITDRKLRQMTENRWIAPLTRDSYHSALRRRAEGTVGKGFTVDGLVALGIIDAPAETAKKPKPAKEWAPPKNATVSERYGDFWLVGKKAGVSTRFDIFDLKGNRVNGGGTLNGIRQAKAEADRYAAVAAQEAAQAEQNNQNDGAKDEPVLFADFPADFADWSEAQTAEFEAWFAGLPVDDTEYRLEGAAAERFKVLRDGSDDGQPDFDAMSDDRLREILTEAKLNPTGDESREDLLDLVKMLPPSTEGGESDTPDGEEGGEKDPADDSDVRSGSGDAEG
jgi:hypothetical protein